MNTHYITFCIASTVLNYEYTLKNLMGEGCRSEAIAQSYVKGSDLVLSSPKTS